MKDYERCPRLLNEERTPGRIGSPDGKPYVAQFQCIKERDHDNGHHFLPWQYTRKSA
jgi:hypothetical protein